MGHQGKVTRREQFLREMDALVPWDRLLALITPNDHPRGGRGRPAQLFDAVRALLEERRLLLRAGTIVDATIIAAPSSTKNPTGKRDPAMRQTKKGNQCGAGAPDRALRARPEALGSRPRGCR